MACILLSVIGRSSTVNISMAGASTLRCAGFCQRLMPHPWPRLSACAVAGLQSCRRAHSVRRHADVLGLGEAGSCADHQAGPRGAHPPGDPLLARPLPAAWLCRRCPLLQRHPLHQGACAQLLHWSYLQLISFFCGPTDQGVISAMMPKMA